MSAIGVEEAVGLWRFRPHGTSTAKYLFVRALAEHDCVLRFCLHGEDNVRSIDMLETTRIAGSDHVF